MLKLRILGGAMLALTHALLVPSCVEQEGDRSGEDPLITSAKSTETALLLSSYGDGLGARRDALARGEIPAAVALQEAGSDGLELMRDAVKNGGTYADDAGLVIFAYLLGEAKDQEALDELADMVELSAEGSELAVAPHAATDAIFAILDDPRRRQDTFEYSLPERDAAVAAARQATVGSNSSALGEGAPPSCQIAYTLADAEGNPITYTDPLGAQVEATFECTQFNGDPIYGNDDRYADLEEGYIDKVISGGGSFVDEYDDGRPSKRYNCAGFAFRELSQNNSLNCSAATMLSVLTKAGVLQKKSGAPAVGDKVFYRPTQGWTDWNYWTGIDEAPAHVAEVQSVGSTTVVRAPDNHSGVFDAAIDAPYFTGGANGESNQNNWTYDVYEWVGGVPNVISAIGIGVDPRYCQDECGGCSDDEVCLDGSCVPKTAQTSCELREPSCCPGQDNSCTAPDAACYCDEYCQEAQDCCPDACSVCGYCS